MVYVACRSIERCCHCGLNDLNNGRIDDWDGLHTGWRHQCDMGYLHSFVGGSREAVGGDEVTVVVGLVFIGSVVDMVLDDVSDLVLCVVSLFRGVCFSISRNSDRVLGSVGISHSGRFVLTGRFVLSLLRDSLEDLD